ncbi:unnamed protein product [Arabidopsis thaliana]|uniref:(thale cress) hypothetical protein n=1 Tax=Arabidopsis thaliana TaxID=3702 RepID=A0A7G2DYE8_ARATH|nr:unnamed protein product [Arabidopsis thaliana]
MKGNNDNNVFYVGHDPVHDEYKVLSMVWEDFSCRNLMNYNGNVSIFQSLNFFRDRIVDVWVLEEGGRSQWSDKKAFVLPDFQMNFQHGDRLWMGGTSRSEWSFTSSLEEKGRLSDSSQISSPLTVSMIFLIFYLHKELNDLDFDMEAAYFTFTTFEHGSHYSY